MSGRQRVFLWRHTIVGKCRWLRAGGAQGNGLPGYLKEELNKMANHTVGAF